MTSPPVGVSIRLLRMAETVAESQQMIFGNGFRARPCAAVRKCRVSFANDSQRQSAETGGKVRNGFRGISNRDSRR